MRWLSKPIYLACGALLALAWNAGDARAQEGDGNTNTYTRHQPPVPGLAEAPRVTTPERFTVQTITKTYLDHPWGMQILPDGRVIVTERAGRIRIVGLDGKLSWPVEGPSGMRPFQGGPHDIALDPNFAQSHLVYWTFFEQRDGENDGLSVARGRLVEEAGKHPRFENVQVVFRTEPATTSYQDGSGRLTFGPDGNLYITVGDRQLPDRVQSLDNHLGKILRIRPDGSIPKDNPFVNRKDARGEIFALGFRSDLGITFDPATGLLWENGNAERGGDEINIVRPGHNYGWPDINYGIHYSGKNYVSAAKAGIDQPVYYWDPSVAPSGMVFYTGDLFPSWKGNLFVGTLAGSRLIRLVVKDNKIVGEERLLLDIGRRVRDVRQGPDGALYLLTDENNGKLLKLVPAK